MEWLHPTYLWALLLVPVLLWFVVRDARWRRRAWERFGNSALAERLASHVQPHRRWIKAGVVLIAISLIVLSLAGPRFGTDVREVDHEGIDLVVVLDVSLSMKAEDVAPTRLDRATNEVHQLLDELTGDRVGLVLFAYDAIIQSPLTTDYSALRLFLDAADPESVPTQGTNFEAAYETALQALEAGDGVERDGDDNETSDRAQAMLFVTDGEVHEGNVSAIREDALDRGIHLYAAGVGTSEGARIPLHDNGEQMGYLHDRNDEIVITRFEEESLLELTRDGGEYFRLGSTSGALTDLRATINQLEQTTFAEAEFESYREQYHWPLLLALLLLVLEPLIPVRAEQPVTNRRPISARID